MSAKSLKISERGKLILDKARIAKGWSLNDFAYKLELSPSTVKRFFSQERVSIQNFIAICRFLDIDWEMVVDNQNQLEVQNNSNITFTINQAEDSLQKPETQTKYSLTITGIFAEDQKLQVEGIVRALSKLLSNGQIIIHSGSDQVTY